MPFCLQSLSWCDDVHVVDSFSHDQTDVIAKQYGAKFIQNRFTGFGDQRNWALEKLKLKYDWVLILDADERTSPELAAEMGERVEKCGLEVGAFRFRRRFHLWGKWLRFSSQYPTWVVRLVRKDRTRYINRGHAEMQVVEGRTEGLEQDLIDENHKDLHAWFARQNDYSTREAKYELGSAKARVRALLTRDPLKRRETLKAIARRLPARPVWFFLYAYFFRLGFLDGIRGLRFCLMKAVYQEMIVLKRFEISGDATTENKPVERHDRRSAG